MWPSVSRFGPLCRRNPSLTNPEMVKTTSLGVKTICGSGCKSWTRLEIHYILRSKNLNPNPRCLNPSPHSTNKNPRNGCFWYFPSSASFAFVCFCHLKVFRQVSLLWTPPDLGRVSPQIKPRNEPLPLWRVSFKGTLSLHRFPDPENFHRIHIRIVPTLVM